MAQGKSAINSSRDKTILLIDDLSSELDLSHQEAVLAELEKLPVQSFITSTEMSLQHIVRSDKDRVFHVKQGQIEQPSS
ncbi:MAG: hypothetical protein JKY76_00805 [Proteobacteria bacterium]|nr:hypothetical protein [Pseudomonadota bacterium]